MSAAPTSRTTSLQARSHFHQVRLIKTGRITTAPTSRFFCRFSLPTTPSVCRLLTASPSSRLSSLSLTATTPFHIFPPSSRCIRYNKQLLRWFLEPTESQSMELRLLEKHTLVCICMNATLVSICKSKVKLYKHALASFLCPAVVFPPFPGPLLHPYSPRTISDNF